MKARDLLLYTTQAEKIKVSVFFQQGSFWLTQKAIALLFGMDRTVITKHLKKIFESKELDENSVRAISSMIGSSGRQRVHEKYLEEFQLPKVDANRMEFFHKAANPIFKTLKLKSLENQKLSELKDLLLSKLATVAKGRTLVIVPKQ